MGPAASTSTIRKLHETPLTSIKTEPIAEGMQPQATEEKKEQVGPAIKTEEKKKKVVVKKQEARMKKERPKGPKKEKKERRAVE